MSQFAYIFYMFFFFFVTLLTCRFFRNFIFVSIFTDQKTKILFIFCRKSILKCCVVRYISHSLFYTHSSSIWDDRGSCALCADLFSFSILKFLFQIVSPILYIISKLLPLHSFDANVARYAKNITKHLIYTHSSNLIL